MSLIKREDVIDRLDALHETYSAQHRNLMETSAEKGELNAIKRVQEISRLAGVIDALMNVRRDVQNIREVQKRIGW